MKKLLVALLGTLLLTGCSLPNVPFISSSTPDRHCIDKFAASYTTFKSNGLWECFSLTMKAGLFKNNSVAPGHSWQGDADIDTWLQGIPAADGLIGIQVEEFKGGPIPVTDSSGNQTGWQYLLKMWKIMPDGTVFLTPVTTFAVTVNMSGTIVSVE